MTRPLRVVIPSRNCPDQIGRAIRSVWEQEVDCDDVAVVVIDDASDDPRHAAAILATCDGLQPRPGWRIYDRTHNERLGATAGIALTVWSMLDDTDDWRSERDAVVVLVDGDDWLLPGALARILRAYTDPSVWVTYGSYTPHPPAEGCHPAEPYPDDVAGDGSYRSAANVFNHPLTFRAYLFAEIPPRQLRLASGEWVPAIYDEAIMYPLLEMAGPDRSLWIPEVMYAYWTENPASVWRDPDELAAATAAGEELRARPALPRLHYQDGGFLMARADDRAALVASYCERYGASTVIETGTGAGDLALALLDFPVVEQLLTVEVDPEVAERASDRIEAVHGPPDWSRWVLIVGDSVDNVRVWSQAIDERPFVWWLDAHRDNWWEGDPATVTPVLAEVELILSRRPGDVVLIDDARLFGRATGYPTVADVEDVAAAATRGTYVVGVEHDIIRLIPGD